MAHFIAEIAESHPPIAAQWAESITDPLTRQAAVIRVSNYWQRTDPKAAIRWRDDMQSR